MFSTLSDATEVKDQSATLISGRSSVTSRWNVVVELHPLRRIEGDEGFVDHLVDRGVRVAALVREGHAIRDPGADEDGGRDRRIAAEDGGGDGEIEGVIGVDRLLVAGAVVGDDGRVDPDRRQRLAQIVAELPRLVEVGRRQQVQLKPHPVGASREARLVQKRLGLLDIEVVDRDFVRVEGGRVLRHRAGRLGGVAEEDRVQHELLVDRMGDGLPHLRGLQVLVAVVDLDDELIGQRLVAPGHDLEPRHLADPVKVDQRYGREGGELDLARLQRARRRGAVGEDTEHDLVEKRLLRIPVARVLLQQVVLARPILAPHEGPGADKGRVHRVLRRCRSPRRGASAGPTRRPAGH